MGAATVVKHAVGVVQVEGVGPDVFRQRGVQRNGDVAFAQSRRRSGQTTGHTAGPLPTELDGGSCSGLELRVLEDDD
jgi:hypothetical protein